MKPFQSGPGIKDGKKKGYCWLISQAKNVKKQCQCYMVITEGDKNESVFTVERRSERRKLPFNVLGSKLVLETCPVFSQPSCVCPQVFLSVQFQKGK